MATRAYRRNSRGQFAGSGGRVTYGKAGGFANASHRSKAANARASKAARRAMIRRVKGAAKIGTVIALRVAVPMVVGAGARRVLAGPPVYPKTAGLITRSASQPRLARSRRGVYNISSF